MPFIRQKLSNAKVLVIADQPLCPNHFYPIQIQYQPDDNDNNVFPPDTQRDRIGPSCSWARWRSWALPRCRCCTSGCCLRSCESPESSGSAFWEKSEFVLNIKFSPFAVLHILAPTLTESVKHENVSDTATTWLYKELFSVGTSTQLVILPPHILWIGQRGGILLLCYSMICVVALPFLILNGRGENRSPSL